MISSSHSIIHRLTPPTCTLEIWGKKSHLSKWTNQDKVQDIHFKLSFDDPALSEEQKTTVSGDREKLEAIYEGVIVYVEKFLQQSFPDNKVIEFPDNTPIHLKSKGLVEHQLFIQDVENSPINLTTVQLFDLVAALEEYKVKVGGISIHTNEKSGRLIPLWLKGAAGLALVVGLATAGTKIVQKQAAESESVASLEKTEIQKEQTQVNDVIPPEIPEQKSEIKPQPEVTEPISSAEKLPSPPKVDTPKPAPDIPDPAKYPIPEGNLVIPPPVKKNTAESKPNSGDSKVESRINIPQQTATKETTNDTEKVESEISTSQQTEDKKATSDELDANKTEINPDTQAKPSADSDSNVSTSEESVTGSDQISANNNDLEKDGDTIVNNQLKEVKDYFKKNWQPPKELSQTIEYRIVINSNGSILRITPIGKASEVFIDRTNIPLMGEKFVSPLKDKSQATVRLLLSPDGEVSAFLE